MPVLSKKLRISSIIFAFGLFLIMSDCHAVMQFGGQHPGGIGVPAVGMAFPGYVAQPQLGLGNSEMTWYNNFFNYFFPCQLLHYSI